MGIVGVGAFSQNFIPLFKAHPGVEGLVLCDLDARKLAENSRRHGIPETSPSLDDLCQRDLDAVAIFTQPWLHAPQVIQALRAGFDVYSAVPTGISIEEIVRLVEAAEREKRIYMLGETSYYYPGVLYCRERYARGDFGDIVYAEAEYYHDRSHGLEEVARWRGGKNWRKTAGFPPMYYATHSTSQVISVTGAHMTDVSCHGFLDPVGDGIFKADVNQWGNAFSDETALFGMSDGSSCRINEFRRIGEPSTVRMSLFGTEGSFEMSSAGSVWVDRRGNSARLDDLLACGEREVDGRTYLGVSQLHPVERLPTDFEGLPNGHCGSHQFLVDDFITACLERKLPPNNAWQAARYAIPGIVAHESAKRSGALLKIPDLGDAPRG